MVIKLSFFFILFLVPISSAVEFSLISPQEVNLDEEFSATIDFQSEEVYDVKIYVHDDVQAYSEIYYGNEWKSTRFFLDTVLPAQKEFRLISHYVGETKICAKIRKNSNSPPSPEKCNDIKIIQIEKEEEQNNETEEEIPQEQENQNLEEETNPEEIVKSEQNPAPPQKNNEEPPEPERIFLNAQAPAIEDGAPKIYRTKQEKIRLGIIYGFSIFTIIIIILLALKKL